MRQNEEWNETHKRDKEEKEEKIDRMTWKNDSYACYALKREPCLIN